MGSCRRRRLRGTPPGRLAAGGRLRRSIPRRRGYFSRVLPAPSRCNARRAFSEASMRFTGALSGRSMPLRWGNKENADQHSKRLPIAMGSCRRRRLRGTPPGRLAAGGRLGRPIPRYAGTSPLTWGSKKTADQLSNSLPAAAGRGERLRWWGTPDDAILNGTAQNVGGRRCVGEPYPPLRGYFPIDMGKQENRRPVFQSLPAAAGRGTASGGGAPRTLRYKRHSDRRMWQWRER